MKRQTLITAVCAMLIIATPALTSCKRSAKKAAEEPAAQEMEVEEDLDAQYAKELLAKGTAAPDFTLQTPDGKSVSIKDFLGKYVVLDFWAS